jgi:hypothetical protein
MNAGRVSAAKEAAEFADELLRVHPDFAKEVGVLIGVDFVGKFLVGFSGFVVLAETLQVLEDLVLVNFH